MNGVDILRRDTVTIATCSAATYAASAESQDKLAKNRRVDVQKWLTFSDVSLCFTIFPTLHNWPRVPQNCRIPWGTRAHKWVLGLTRVHTPIGTSIGTSVFSSIFLQLTVVGLTVVSNRQDTQAHRPRYVCSNRPLLMLCDASATRPYN